MAVSAPSTARDRRLLRELAKRRLEIAHDPVNLERRQAWLDLHSGAPSRPMVLAEWGGIREASPPFDPELRCVDGWAQGLERALRQDIWVFEELRDDHAFEPFLDRRWHVSTTGYGVEPVEHRVDSDYLTARSWDAPITDIDAQFDLLQLIHSRDSAQHLRSDPFLKHP